MLRLMGLPATSRCADVSVRRRATVLELRFSGPDCDYAFDVDARLLDPGADLEIEELTLLMNDLIELARRAAIRDQVRLHRLDKGVAHILEDLAQHIHAVDDVGALLVQPVGERDTTALDEPAAAASDPPPGPNPDRP